MTLDLPAHGRASRTPLVFIKLEQRRVTSDQRAKVKVALSARAGRAAAAGERQSPSLGSGRIKVVAKGADKNRPTFARLVHGKATVTLPRLPDGVYRIRATFLGNELLTKARSKYKTLRVGDGGDGGASGFPGESNTGVRAGTTLKPYTGSSTISRANTVIEGKTLGCIEVDAPGVVIRNSRISCRPGYAVVEAADGAYTGTPLLLEDVEIDCKNGPGNAVGEANVTVRRADIHGCENGFDINQSFTVEDSYIHDLYNTSDSHSDGIQLAGHLANGSFVDGALNVTIRHNTIYGVGSDGSLGTSAIITNRSGDRNVLIQDNLLAGGAYTLYCDADTATNFRVVDNHFSRLFSSKVGAFGPSDGCSDETLSGNVYHETGASVRLS